MLELKGLTDTEYNIIKSPFELVMITLTANGGEHPGPDGLESAMYYMEQSIRQTIRNDRGAWHERSGFDGAGDHFDIVIKGHREAGFTELVMAVSGRSFGGVFSGSAPAYH